MASLRSLLVYWAAAFAGLITIARCRNSTGGGFLKISVAEVAEKDGAIKVAWTLNESWSNPADTRYFVVSYTLLGNDTGSHTDGQNATGSTIPSDFGMEFKSGPLPYHIRTLTLHLLSTYDVEICVTANQKTGQQFLACYDWLTPSADVIYTEGIDLKKTISGIAAGCIFLIPCAVLIAVIVRKDKQMKRSSLYEELGNEKLNPGFEDDDEKKKISPPANKPAGNAGTEEAEAGASGGVGVGRWQTLSLEGVKEVKAPVGDTMIYIHSVTEEAAAERVISQKL